MTLDSLIIDFTKLNDSIAAATHDEDEARLYRLDSDIQDVFEKILAYVPNTKEQRIAHCSILLDQLAPAVNRQGASQHIYDRILRLVSEA